MNIKYKILVIALLGIFLVTVFYVYYKKEDNQQDENFATAVPDKVKLNKDIDSILMTFGIKKIWIKDLSNESKSKNTKNNFLVSKEVSIPGELPVIELNYEITNYLHGNGITEKVTEEPKSKNLAMSIYNLKDTAKDEIGQIRFIYSDTLKRDKADICIVIDSTDAAAIEQLDEILNSPEALTFVLPLRNDKMDLQTRIIESGKDFVIQLSAGSDDDVTADFRENMKESFWKSLVKSFALNFPSSSGIILKNDAENEFTQEVEKEFLKNGITFYRDTIFSNFKSGQDRINLLLENIKSESDNGKKILFYRMKFSPDEFKEFTKKIYLFKKLGYKFYSFSEMQKRINKRNENPLPVKK